MHPEKLIFNRNYHDKDNFSIGIEDLSIHRGYGVFDFMRSYSGKVLWLDRYMSRLSNSIQNTGLPMNMSIGDIESDIKDLLKYNAFQHSFVKVIVTGGYSADYSAVVGPANVLIINSPVKLMDSSLYNTGAKILSHHYTRPQPLVKTTNYMVAMQLYPQMKEAGAVEILFGEEFVSEASRSNIFFVKNGSIYTPSREILKGVTRSVVMDLFDVAEVDIPMAERFHFDEIFITSTVKGVLPICDIDGYKINQGKVGDVTKEIMNSFHANIASLV